MTLVEIKVNGQARAVPAGSRLDQVVGESTALSSGVAAAVNGEIVPRGEWGARALRNGDRVEIVTAVQGG